MAAPRLICSHGRRAGRQRQDQLVEQAGLIKPADGGRRIPRDYFFNRHHLPDHRPRAAGWSPSAAVHPRRPRPRRSTSTRRRRRCFTRGALLYNFAQAPVRPPTRPATVIVAEGYMDVIALAQAGFAQRGGAPGHGADRGPDRGCSGAWRTNRCLCFDGDTAGRARRLARGRARVAPAYSPGKLPALRPAAGRRGSRQR